MRETGRRAGAGQLHIVTCAPPGTPWRARGSYMGFSRLGLALGGALGYTGGGWMYDLGRSFAMPELPWALLGLIGLLTLAILYWQFSLRAPCAVRQPRSS